MRIDPTDDALVTRVDGGDGGDVRSKITSALVDWVEQNWFRAPAGALLLQNCPQLNESLRTVLWKFHERFCEHRKQRASYVAYQFGAKKDCFKRDLRAELNKVPIVGQEELLQTAAALGIECATSTGYVNFLEHACQTFGSIPTDTLVQLAAPCVKYGEEFTEQNFVRTKYDFVSRGLSK